MADTTDLKSVGFNQPCRFESGLGHHLRNMKLNMKTATLIQDNLKGFNGHAALYQVNPPMAIYTWIGRHEQETMHDFVVVSSVHFHGTPETYIFPASDKGKVLDWVQMEGSARGIYSHEDRKSTRLNSSHRT